MTRKERSVQHEETIARMYYGERSPSSGASTFQKGDVQVRTTRTSFECKASGSPPSDSKATTITRHMEKIADEAWTENREPALALRYFNPHSSLADNDGWVDLVVRLASDDAEREQAIAWLLG